MDVVSHRQLLLRNTHLAKVVKIIASRDSVKIQQDTKPGRIGVLIR